MSIAVTLSTCDSSDHLFWKTRFLYVQTLEAEGERQLLRAEEFEFQPQFATVAYVLVGKVLYSFVP